MSPGDVCHYSGIAGPDTSRVQSYEQRVATARQQLPFAFCVGALAAGFGCYLLVSSGREGHRPVDHPITVKQRDLGGA